MIKNKFHVILFYILETILQTCRIQNTPWQQAQISCFTSSNSSKCYPRFGVDFFALIDWDVSLKILYNPNSLAFHGISFWGPHLQTIPCVEDWQSVAVIYKYIYIYISSQKASVTHRLQGQRPPLSNRIFRFLRLS